MPQDYKDKHPEKYIKVNYYNKSAPEYIRRKESSEHEKRESAAQERAEYKKPMSKEEMKKNLYGLDVFNALATKIHHEGKKAKKIRRAERLYDEGYKRFSKGYMDQSEFTRRRQNVSKRKSSANELAWKKYKKLMED